MVFVIQIAGSPSKRRSHKITDTTRCGHPDGAGQRDDDDYFAGTYPASIGVLTQDERTDDPIDPSNASSNPVGFERAVTSGSTNNRIHFKLSASEADPNATDQFTMNRFAGGYWTGSVNGGWGTHDVQVHFNGNLINESTGITANFAISETLSPAAVGAVTAGNSSVTVLRGPRLRMAETVWC